MRKNDERYQETTSTNDDVLWISDDSDTICDVARVVVMSGITYVDYVLFCTKTSEAAQIFKRMNSMTRDVY